MAYISFSARLTTDSKNIRLKKESIARDLEDAHRIDAINGLKTKSDNTKALERKLRSIVKRYRNRRF